ncbi:ATP-binding protein [Alteromonas sp. KUL49]|uniref:AAA family ATPase n=1 Tax=Alteromonas sp. KUL49 TaxID=2480798 RepID=UPI00102EF6B3|nr:ATP-binding protein [Alteromonas sp. KUL49]TAP42115.1 AAA family ATPase [Alteromonas sp. KUL49]GEA09697.1 ATPase AAA [Alteromonas sp. KUL49]
MGNKVSIADGMLIEILRDGMKGSLDSLAMRGRRLASSIRKDNPELASQIQEAIGHSSNIRGIQSHKLPLPVDNDTRQNLLVETYPVVMDVKPMWEERTFSTLLEFVRERQFSDKLIDEGLLPARSMLLEGPPGVGKTLAAKWLAHTLDMPLLTLDLATVMSSFLGKTGNNIRAVLKYAQSFPCVLLLDEFDSIAKKRDDDSDVGELKRLVTVLLQSIDDWPASSIMIAATNHAELLDPAVWRRFDKIVSFQVPNSATTKNYLVLNDVNEFLADLISHSTAGCSFSAIEKKLNQAKKNTVLQNSSYSSELLRIFNVSETDLGDSEKLKKEFNIIKMTNEGYSQRKISEKLGVSRGYIKNYLVRVEQGNS